MWSRPAIQRLRGRPSEPLRAAPGANPAAGRRVTRIVAGEHHVSTDPENAISTVLGSCVAACIRDPVAGIGGMNHFMLPSSDLGTWGRASASLRYGNFAMERLINDILSGGGLRRRLEAKVFGGAHLLNDTIGIGERNARFVQDYLTAEGVQVLAADLFGRHGRKLIYLPVAGVAFVSPLAGMPTRIAEDEQRYRRTLPRHAAAGSIELFD